jgi:indole-3-glycerol phosphate synthase
MSADVLSRIAEATRASIAAGRYGRLPADAPAPDGARFAASLREPGTRIIAELKRRSPSAGEISPHLDRRIETFALAYRRGHAAAISVVTEREFFGGDPGWIARARRISGLPVLMKDFILEESQIDFAVSAGADAILLIVALLDDTSLSRLRAEAAARGLAVLVEAHGREEIRRAAAAGADIVGVNARNLRTMSVDLGASAALAAAIPSPAIRVAESGIERREQIEMLAAAGFQAFLVGETLLRSDDPEETLRSLRGAA